MKISLTLSVAVCSGAMVFAQTAQTQRPPAFPTHAAGDPAAADRGKALYGVNCNFCHGSDARGGEGGPNLLRSDLVLNDKNGELIAQVVQHGRGEMPALKLSNEQIADVAAYLHNFKVGGSDESRMKPPSILVGDAKAGAAAFGTKCASCHSTTGDLKGVATRYTDHKVLQQTFLLPSAARGRNITGPPVTVTVSLPDRKVEGRLVHIDDFVVTLTDSEGWERTFRREGDIPKVELHDPLAGHRSLLPTYSDKEIHDITAYLVTLK